MTSSHLKASYCPPVDIVCNYSQREVICFLLVPLQTPNTVQGCNFVIKVAGDTLRVLADEPTATQPELFQ